MAFLKEYRIRGRTLAFPAFFPDATRGVIRTIDGKDLAATGTEGVIVNTYHLMSEPGTATVEALGGIKKFMGWDGFVISDSGGFQLLSLVYKEASFGKVSDDGVIFLRHSKGHQAKYIFTPEVSIDVQFSLDPDVLICLDDCPAANATEDENAASVRRTIEWAKRCKEEFLKQVEARRMKASERPLLFAVVQGADDKSRREKCAQGLLDIGFDGYCFGGWPAAKTASGVKSEILEFTASLLPDALPKYALGVGNLQGILECTKMGYGIFDTVLPTRDARHERLYNFKRDPDSADILSGTNEENFEFLYIGREQYAKDGGPISEYCDCHTCKNYSRAYLRHLFSIHETLAGRLATIHNLRTYAKLTEVLRKKII